MWGMLWVLPEGVTPLVGVGEQSIFWCVLVAPYW